MRVIAYDRRGSAFYLSLSKVVVAPLISKRAAVLIQPRPEPSFSVISVTNPAKEKFEYHELTVWRSMLRIETGINMMRATPL